jgi:hypothetical protein
MSQHEARLAAGLDEQEKVFMERMGALWPTSINAGGIDKGGNGEGSGDRETRGKTREAYELSLDIQAWLEGKDELDVSISVS